MSPGASIRVGVIRPQRGARASNIPRTNPHEDFIHIFQDMYGLDDVDPEDMQRPLLDGTLAEDRWSGLRGTLAKLRHHRAPELSGAG